MSEESDLVLAQAMLEAVVEVALGRTTSDFMLSMVPVRVVANLYGKLKNEEQRYANLQGQYNEIARQHPKLLAELDEARKARDKYRLEARRFKRAADVAEADLRDVTMSNDYERW